MDLLSGPSASAHQAARRAVRGIDRDGRVRILAAVAHRVGDLDLAEDATQEALLQALRTWPETGVPRSPLAWLTTTAKRKALDVVRREQVLARKLVRHGRASERDPAPAGLDDPAEQHPPDGLDDDRLSLFFACAHPVLKLEDRLALTLRFVAGLDSVAVAHALLLPLPTLQQRLVRAKRRIRTLGVPFTAPAREHLAERLTDVQRVIYLLYSEGFARSTGDVHTRDDLTTEAIRLTRVLHELVPATAEVMGMLGLLLLTEARRPSRIDPSGAPIPLAAQDRTRWDQRLISEGISLTEAAASSPQAAGYTIQAAIAAVHAEATHFDATDWAQIAVLYRLLEAHEPGPVVRLGRAVALGKAHGPKEGIRHLDALAGDPVLDRLRAFHIARAVTLEALKDGPGAAEAYRLALSVPGNTAEDNYLTAALAGVEAPAGDPDVRPPE